MRMNLLSTKVKPAIIMLISAVMFVALVLSADTVRAEDGAADSESVVAKALEIESGPTYIGAIEGEDYVPYGVRANVTVGNETDGYTKYMGKQVFDSNNNLKEGFSYSLGTPENGRMKVTISYTEGGKTVSDSFEVDVISRENVPAKASDGYYEIGTAEELQAFSLMVGAVGMSDINARLTADIDMTKTEYNPIGQYYTDARKSENTADVVQNCIGGSYYHGFKGNFDGNGKTVTFNLTASRCAALIGIAYKGCEIKDVTVAGSITARSNGYPAVGAGVVALVRDGAITVENCTNEADITSQSAAGGIICSGPEETGSSTMSTAVNCVNKGSITAKGGNVGGIAGQGAAKDCINEGKVTGGCSHVGGVVGTGSVENCLNTGEVYHDASDYTNVGGVIGSVIAGGKLVDCVNTGNVTGSNSAGGVAGMTFNCGTTTKDIVNCYNYGDVTSVKNDFHYGIGGIVGIQAEDVVGLTIKGCCNLGTVTDGSEADKVGETGAFVGYSPKLPTDINPSTQAFTIEDSYYLDGCADAVVGYMASERSVNDKSEKVNFGKMTSVLEKKYEDGDLPYGDAQMKALEGLKTDVSKRSISLSSDECVYSGAAVEPAVTVEGLNEKDYTVSYSDNTNAGTASVTVSGTGDYSGSRKVKFEIKPCSLEDCSISKPQSLTYTGEKLTQKLTVKHGDIVLAEDMDYTVSYSNNVYPGTAEMTITGKGNYTGSVKLEFDITVRDLAAPSSVKADLSGYNAVKVSWSRVDGASGYKVYYRESGSSKWQTAGTTAALNLTKSNLTAGKQYIFKVNPYQIVKGTVYDDTSYKASSGVYTLKKLNTPSVKKASSKYVKITWNNIPGESGYQIARSKNKTKNFAVVKTVSSKYKTVKVKATKKKTYYYKIRAYKTVNGEKVYGPWSSVKKYKLK